MHEADRRRLHSWKEIASFLEVTPRTARNWEAERGLPARRLGDGPKARVFAYVDELEAWRNAKERSQNEIRSGRRWLVPAAIVTLALGAAAIAWVLVGQPPGVPSQIVIEQSQLTVIDDNGERWRPNLEPVDPIEYEITDPDRGRLTWVHDIDGDGKPEVLVVHRARMTNNVLYCFDADRSLRWRFEFGRTISITDPGAAELVVFERLYYGYIVGAVATSDRKYLVVHASHTPRYPNQIALLDPATGELLDDYYHPGGLRAIVLHDLDQDGVEEIVFGGYNNPGEGDGHAAVGVLHVPFGDPHLGLNRFMGDQYAVEQHYVLFPRPDAAQVKPTVDSITVLEGNRLDVRTWAKPLRLYFTLDEHLKVQNFRVLDEATTLHDRLVDEHRLTQEEIDGWGRPLSFPTAPYGNDPLIAAQLANQ